MTKCIVATIETDSHTWNLIYLQLLLEELGFSVTNLGPCVPWAELASAIRTIEPELLVISTTNGSGHTQGRVLMQALKTEFRNWRPATVIGGQFSIGASANQRAAEELMAAGYDAVFTGSNAVAHFLEFVKKRLPDFLEPNDREARTAAASDLQSGDNVTKCISLL